MRTSYAGFYRYFGLLIVVYSNEHEPAQLRDFQWIVEHHAEAIVQKWIDYFILHRPVSSEDITRRIR